MRADRERLGDILDSVAALRRAGPKEKSLLLSDERIQGFVLWHLQVIGEAVRALSGALIEQHRIVPWQQIASMRNIIVHGYFGIDFDTVWTVITEDLPPLSEQIEEILRTLDE